MIAVALAFQAGAQNRRVEANTVNAVNANWPFKFGGRTTATYSSTKSTRTVM